MSVAFMSRQTLGAYLWFISHKSTENKILEPKEYLEYWRKNNSGYAGLKAFEYFESIHCFLLF